MKSTFAERLKKALAYNNMSAAELCRRTDTPESVMSQYKSGKYVAKQKRLDAYAKILNVSIPWLMGEDVPMENTKLPEGAIPVDISTFIKIPVYGEVSAGAGCLADNYIIGYEYVTPDSINKYDDYFFLKVKGDSMEPQICNGDYALIQKQSSIDSGSLAVVIIDNENGVIKKVNCGLDWIELVSFNPYYPPRRFEGSDVQRISVVGLVKEIKRKF